jgi:hypothetical protein
LAGDRFEKHSLTAGETVDLAQPDFQVFATMAEQARRKNLVERKDDRQATEVPITGAIQEELLTRPRQTEFRALLTILSRARGRSHC